MGRFQKGISGNPNGKPKGARHYSSLLAEQLLTCEIEEICKAVLKEAKVGNMQAVKIILDRVLPPRKDRPIEIDLPKMDASVDLTSAIGCVVNAVGAGQISPSEGEALARIIEVYAKTLELVEFEQRLAVLEKRIICNHV